MRIAIVGSGAAGLGAAYALADHHDVAVFERDARFGGHANTVDVDYDGAPVAVDVGFIVFNRRNYPNLCGLLADLGVADKPSDMSFGFSLDGGRFEYACDDLDRIFAQRRNIARPAFWWNFREALRFCRLARADLAAGRLAGRSLGEWLADRRFSALFRDRFLLPMGGAIWSTPAALMLEFPAENLIAFFANHDLLAGLEKAKEWRTVDGGSREYVDRVIARIGRSAHCGRGVVAVRRGPGGVNLVLDDGRSERFDHVVLACHAPESFALLADQDPDERAILGAFRVTRNRAVLHRDPALMPRRRKVWSSWSMISQGHGPERAVALSYYMNRLQGIDPAKPLFVTLNAPRDPDPALTFAEFDYTHPFYDRDAFAAQARLDEIQGRGGVWHAGAWTGWGFHEDGLRSGLRVAGALGARPAWAAETGPPLMLAPRIAAE